MRCELLSNQYLCSCKHNNPIIGMKELNVVNCFQISIFAVANTTNSHGTAHAVSCELLSNQYLCSCKHNNYFVCVFRNCVVNCFQISIFAVANTTQESIKTVCNGCELLSNQYLCSCKHNIETKKVNPMQVVNCFQISIFAVANTTVLRQLIERNRL